jgi:uncharacterized protein YybS (DUF2232 family)
MEMDAKRFPLHVLLGTGATLLIFVVSLRAPLVGLGTALLTPLPVMIVCHRWDVRGGILVVLIVSLVTSAVFSPFLGAVFFTEFGLMGLLLHYWVEERRLPWDRGILLSSLIVLATLALVVTVQSKMAAVNVADWMREEIRETGRRVLRAYIPDTTTPQSLLVDLERLTNFTLRILPALMILTVWLEGILNVALLTWFTKRFLSSHRRAVMKPEFSLWIFPDRLVWGGILGGFLMVTRISPLVTIGINVVILLLAIYFLQGMAVVSFYFQKKNVPLGFRVMGYTMIGLIQFLLILVAALGLFDIWADFRNLRRKAAV